MTVSAFSFPAPVTGAAVIACLDTASKSREVAAAAADYARWLDRPLILFHSVEFDRAQSRMPDPLEWHLLRGRALRKLEEARVGLSESSPSPSLEINEGDWIEALSHRLQSITDPVVVVGTDRHGNTGHMVSTLLDNGAGKVLVVPPGVRQASTRLPRVAVPLDGSLFSEAALAQAIAIAKSRPSELLLIHVMPQAGIDSVGPLADSDRELQTLVERRNEEVACKFLQAILRRLEDMGLQARSLCLTGDPRSCIANLLFSEEPELVVLSARGQGVGCGTDLALGSTANYLLDHLHLPIMLVGSREAGGQMATKSSNRDRQAPDHRGPLNSSPVVA